MKNADLPGSRHLSFRVGVLLVVALLEAAAPRSASAGSAADADAARAFFIEGTKLAKQGRWKEAQELYARSLQRRPAAITRYSLGVAQKETGHIADALSSFRAFLAEPPTPATAPYAAAARAAIVELEGRIGRVTIVIEPHPIDGLTVAMDGQPAPPVSDSPLDIEAGLHEVVARAPGFRRATAWFTVAEGGRAAVAITLVRGPTAAGAHAVLGSPGRAPKAVDSAVAPDPPPPPVAPRPTLSIVLMASGGAVFAGGAALGLVGVAQASRASTRDGAGASSAWAKGIAGDVLCGVGIASVAAGALLLVTRGRARPPTKGAVRPSLGGAAAGIEVYF